MMLLVAGAVSVGAQAPGNGGDVPTTHRPPPGMCRIWIDGVPAGRQPAPTDCATALRRRPPNARVIFGDEVRGGRNGAPRLPQAQGEEPRVIEQGFQPSPAQPAPSQPVPSTATEQRGADPRSAQPSAPAAAPPRTAEPQGQHAGEPRGQPRANEPRGGNEPRMPQPNRMPPRAQPRPHKPPPMRLRGRP